MAKYEYIGVALILVAIGGSGIRSQLLEDRDGIINATILTSMRQFPHQVGIHVDSDRSYYCSGSILTPHWILTAMTCAVTAPYRSVITLMFNRLDVSANALSINDSKTFTVQINEANVFAHSGANLALVRLPVALQFTENVAPVALAIDPLEQFYGRHVVMAGTKQNTTLQAYGQFEIIPPRNCSAVYPWFNDNDEVCTRGWQNSTTVPCYGAQGGGLLIDWPVAPRLVAVFSAPLSCLSSTPAEYYKVSRYLPWIEEVIGARVRNTGYFV